MVMCSGLAKEPMNKEVLIKRSHRWGERVSHPLFAERAVVQRTITSLCVVLFVLGVTAFPIGIGTSRCVSNRSVELDVLPKHFLLHPGEQVHYTVLQRSESDKPQFVNATFAIGDTKILRPIKPVGVFEAAAPGRTEVNVRTQTSELRIMIEVAGRAQTKMAAVPYTDLNEIAAKDLLFVGHANLDGFDHTAVAKAGIDRLARREEEWRDGGLLD